MYCTKCGEKNVHSTPHCLKCNAVMSRPEDALHPRGGLPGSVPNYLVQSILVTLFCCLPAGIVAIIYAAQVNGKLEEGDIEGALKSSRNAKMWSWISFGVCLTAVGAYLIFVMTVMSRM